MKAKNPVRLVFTLLAVGLAAGCGDPTRPPSTHAEAAVAPSAPSAPSAVATEPPSAGLERAERPVTLARIAMGSGEGAKQSTNRFTQWTRDGELSAEVRVASLRQLGSVSQVGATEAAMELVHDGATLTDPLLGPNAVALLAQSDDPLASEAIARLPERHRRLALALRKERQRQ